MTAPVVRDMALRPAEFLHWLPAAAGPLGWRAEEARVLVGAPGCGVAITMQPLPDRTIGKLRLPVTRVTMTFDGLPEVDRKSFLARFDRAFHRGGG